MERGPDEPQRERQEDGEVFPLERWIEPFFHDMTLWPVGIVVAITFVTLGVTTLLMAFADGNFLALGTVLVLVWLSVDLAVRARRRGRFGRVGRSLAVYWLLTVASAFAVARAGWF